MLHDFCTSLLASCGWYVLSFIVFIVAAVVVFCLYSSGVVCVCVCGVCVGVCMCVGMFGVCWRCVMCMSVCVCMCVNFMPLQDMTPRAFFGR